MTGLPPAMLDSDFVFAVIMTTIGIVLGFFYGWLIFA